MGSGASMLPSEIDEVLAKSLAGDKFDKAVFDTAAKDGKISRDEALKFAADTGIKVAMKIRLQYMNARGISETTRCIFAIGGVEFEDLRYQIPSEKDADYVKAKESGELDATGGLPYLEIDGVRIGGYFPIYRTAAKIAGLMGTTEVEAGQIDMLSEKLRDIRNDWLDEKKDEEKGKTWIAEKFPEALQKLEKQVPAASGGPFLMGSKVSFADVYLWRFFKDGGISIPPEAAEAAYEKLPPKLKAAVDATGSIPELVAWLEKRPKTEF